MNRVISGRSLRVFLMAVLAAAAAFREGAALAQAVNTPSAPPAENIDQSADTNQDNSQLAEVIVTANKQRENLQDVPIAISTVSGNQLEAVGISSLDEVAAVIPGITILNGFAGGFQPHLRGVGTNLSTLGVENSVAVYVDGVYLSSLKGSLMSLASIDQIEVDKGPQGTLFGRNATGGVIDVTTRDPSQAVGGEGSITYGNYNTVSTSDYLTGGIAPDLAADIAVYYSHQGDGYGTDKFTGASANITPTDLAVRTKWVLTPTDADKITLALDNEEVNTNAGGPSGDAAPGRSVAADAGYMPHPPYFYSGSPWDTDDYYNGYENLHQYGASLREQHDFAFAHLISITAERQTFVDYAEAASPSPYPDELLVYDTNEHEFTQELQLGSLPDSVVKWTTGLYYFNDIAGTDPEAYDGDLYYPSQDEFISTQRVQSYAGYGQFTLPLRSVASALGNTDLTGGIRYTVERHEIVGDTVVALAPPVGSTAISDSNSEILNPYDTGRTFSEVTWRVSLDHHFTDDLMGYISDNRGFESGQYNNIFSGCGAGGINCTNGEPKPVKPELLDDYEIGLKSDLLDHRLRIDSAIFYYDYSDLQVQQRMVYLGQSTTTFSNAAAAAIYGIDVDITAKATKNLTFTAGFEGLHSRFTSFPDANLVIPNPNQAVGGNITEIGNATGNQLPYAPEVVGNLTADYLVPVAYGSVDFNLTYTYSSGWYAGADNSYRTKPTSLVDGQVGWTLPDDRTHANLWVKNLANAAIPEFVVETGNPGGTVDETFAPPRTFGFTLQHDF